MSDHLRVKVGDKGGVSLREHIEGILRGPFGDAANVDEELRKAESEMEAAAEEWTRWKESHGTHEEAESVDKAEGLASFDPSAGTPMERADKVARIVRAFGGADQLPQGEKGDQVRAELVALRAWAIGEFNSAPVPEGSQVIESLFNVLQPNEAVAKFSEKRNAFVESLLKDVKDHSNAQMSTSQQIHIMTGADRLSKVGAAVIDLAKGDIAVLALFPCSLTLEAAARAYLDPYLKVVAESRDASLVASPTDTVKKLITVFHAVSKFRAEFANVLSRVVCTPNPSDTVPVADFCNASMEIINPVIKAAIEEAFKTSLAEDSDMYNRHGALQSTDTTSFVARFPNAINVPKRLPTFLLAAATFLRTFEPLLTRRDMFKTFCEMFVSAVPVQLQGIVRRMEQMADTSGVFLGKQFLYGALGGALFLRSELQYYAATTKPGAFAPEIDRLSSLASDWSAKAMRMAAMEIHRTVIPSVGQFAWHEEKPVQIAEALPGIQHLALLMQSVFSCCNTFVTVRARETLYHRLTMTVIDALFETYSPITPSHERAPQLLRDITTAVAFLKGVSLFNENPDRREAINRRLAALLSMASIHNCSAEYLSQLRPGNVTGAAGTPAQILGRLRLPMPTVLTDDSQVTALLAEVSLPQWLIDDQAAQSCAKYLARHQTNMFVGVIANRHDADKLKDVIEAFTPSK